MGPTAGATRQQWRATVEEQRAEVLERIEDSPSLRQILHERLPDAYLKTLRMAVRETGLHRDALPAAYPFTVDRALDPEFWPD